MSKTNIVRFMQGTQAQVQRLLPRQVSVPALRTFSNFRHRNSLSSNISTSQHPTSTLLSKRKFTASASKMGVEKTMISEGSGPSPKSGDQVTMEYTGWISDSSKPNNKGDQFDTSVGRGDFETAIGVGRVIKGWDEGVPTMKIGEKALLTISPDYGYGARGFPGAIPPNATLLFEVTLKKINGKSS